ncbi:MAG: hypothetical protein IKV35_06185 [Clostridia bacterium]|nr:hypothetical protein [Clostridia bacterium]
MDDMITPLIKRVFLFLEYGDWASADTYCEKVLDLNPEYAEAYVGKLMASLQVSKRENLADYPQSFEGNPHFQLAMRFADDALKAELQGYLDAITHADNAVATATANPPIEPLVKRMFMFLEDGDWASADTYCEKVLDLDPERAEAYVGKLMVALKLSHREQLSDCNASFEEHPFFQKAMRFGDDALKTELQGHLDVAKTVEKNELYNKAVSVMQTARTEQYYQAAAHIFEKVGNFRDAPEQAQRCLDAISDLRYRQAVSYMDEGSIPSLTEASKLFKTIPDWKDAKALCEQCESAINELEATFSGETDDVAVAPRDLLSDSEDAPPPEPAAWKMRLKLAIAITVILQVVAFIVGINIVFEKPTAYKSACRQMDDEFYIAAVDAFKELGDYKDSEQKVKECMYLYVTKKGDHSDSTTYEYLQELIEDDYKDCEEIADTMYKWRITLRYVNTTPDSTKTIDSIPLDCDYLYMSFMLQGGKPGETITVYHETQWPSEKAYKSDWTWDDVSDYSYLGCEWSEGITTSKKGTFYIHFYNAETHERIETISIPVK